MAMDGIPIPQVFKQRILPGRRANLPSLAHLESAEDLKIRLDVVLCGKNPGLERGHKGVVAEIHQHRSSRGFLDKGGRSSWNLRLFGKAGKVAAPPLDIGAGIIDFFPGNLGENMPPR
jgi:hypothetical protein